MFFFNEYFLSCYTAMILVLKTSYNQSFIYFFPLGGPERLRWRWRFLQLMKEFSSSIIEINWVFSSMPRLTPEGNWLGMIQNVWSHRLPGFFVIGHTHPPDKYLVLGLIACQGQDLPRALQVTELSGHGIPGEDKNMS